MTLNCVQYCTSVGVFRKRIAVFTDLAEILLLAVLIFLEVQALMRQLRWK